MKKHASKIDIYCPILLVLVLGYLIVDLTLKKEWLGVFIMSAILLLVLTFLFSIGYLIENQCLTLKCGGFKKLVKIREIHKISKAYSVLSSPFTASFDRLEVFYGKYDSVMVSPKNKEKFINDLLEINPTISVDI